MSTNLSEQKTHGNRMVRDCAASAKTQNNVAHRDSLAHMDGCCHLQSTPKAVFGYVGCPLAYLECLQDDFHAWEAGRFFLVTKLRNSSLPTNSIASVLIRHPVMQPLIRLY